MAIKITGYAPPPEPPLVTYTITCLGCRAILEYTKKDTEIFLQNEYDGLGDDGIRCPGCKREVLINPREGITG